MAPRTINGLHGESAGRQESGQLGWEWEGGGFCVRKRMV